MEVSVEKLREKGLKEEDAVSRTLCDEMDIELMKVET